MKTRNPFPRAALGVVLALGLVRCAPSDDEVIDWILADPHSIGGHETTVLGDPQPITLPWGPALLFDGVDDAIVIDEHPLQGARYFTVEAWFRPDPDGPDEQRFLHLQENATEDRILLETRLVEGGRWFLDTYIKTWDEAHTLYARESQHPLGEWYHVALVVTETSMSHYVNGKLEKERKIELRPPLAGRTSIGMRLNQVSPFKGAIARIRFSFRPLTPEEFLSLPG